MRIGASENPTPQARPQAPEAKVPGPVKAMTTADRVKVQAAPPATEAERLAAMKAAVEAARTAPAPAEAPVAAPAQEPPPEATRAMVAEPYSPPEVIRPPVNGGAPALDLDQMDPAIINANPDLKLLYAMKDKAPWLLRSYKFLSKVLGPLGAVANLGYSAYSMVRILRDRRAHPFLKASVVGSTALAGVSAAAAVRVGLHAWKLWPLGTESAMLAGRIAGVTGLGAGALLAAMDTFNTFRDPKATPAAKGVSAVGTAAAFALTGLVAVGVGGPVVIGLGALAMVLPFLKNRLAKNETLNRLFGGIGQAWQGLTGARSR